MHWTQCPTWEKGTQTLEQAVATPCVELRYRRPVGVENTLILEEPRQLHRTDVFVLDLEHLTQVLSCKTKTRKCISLFLSANNLSEGNSPIFQEVMQLGIPPKSHHQTTAMERPLLLPLGIDPATWPQDLVNCCPQN